MLFSAFDPSKYTHTWSSVQSGEAPAQPPHVTLYKINLFDNTLNYINIYYRTIISPINI